MQLAFIRHVTHRNQHFFLVVPQSGNTPLILAARNGHVRAVALLAERGRANVNASGQGGQTALHHAARNDHIDALKYLLDEAKASADVEDDSGTTALGLAARAGNLKCLEMLAGKGASLDHVNHVSCMHHEAGAEAEDKLNSNAGFYIANVAFSSLLLLLDYN